MKKIKKSEFIPWQRYEFDHTFMYQGFLLLLSGAVSVLLFFGLVLILSLNKESVFITVIHNGNLISTSVSAPMFWTAISIAACIAALLLFSGLLSLIFRKILVHDDHFTEKVEKFKSAQIVFRMRRIILLQCTFYVTVYLLWLYASAVFAFVIRNGMVLYPVIFIMLTILTFFGKKIFCFPIYAVMKKQQDKEKMRRSDEYLLLKTDEGASLGNVITKNITHEKESRIFSVVDNALKYLHASAESVKIIMGEGVTLKRMSPKKFSVTIGISALTMLTEDELSAKIKCEAMKLKSPCLDAINRFVTLNKAVAFSSSSWNLLERVYIPFNIYIVSEMSLVPHLLVAADENFIQSFAEKAGEETERNAVVAEIKQWIYNNHEFGYDKELCASLMKTKRPANDYHKRLMKRYWAYMSQNETKIISRLSEIGEGAPPIFPYNSQRLAEFAVSGKLDLQKRPKGEYNDEVKGFSKEFDTAFALCVRPSYRQKRRRLYLDPTERIKKFEGERINGVEKTDGEILRVASDYLRIMMPSASLSVLSELEDKDSLNAKILKGEALIRIGDRSGVDLLLSACEENPRIAHYVNSTLLPLFTLILPDSELKAARTKVKAALLRYGATRIQSEKVWYLDELTGEYRLTYRCSPSKLSSADKERISGDLQKLCGDRLEWIAAVNYTDNGKSCELIVVRISKLTSGSYTDSYIDCVYLDNLDMLSYDIRLYSDALNTGTSEIVSDCCPDAPYEAFDKLKGSIICHKGSIAAKKFLSREARSFNSSEDEFDGIDE